MIEIETIKVMHVGDPEEYSITFKDNPDFPEESSIMVVEYADGGIDTQEVYLSEKALISLNKMITDYIEVKYGN